MLKSKRAKGIIIIVLAVLIGTVVFPMMTQDIVTVVRVNKVIPKNTLIESSMITAAEIGKYGMAEDVLTDSTAVIGKYAVVDIYPGDNLTAAKLSETQPGDARLKTLANDEVAVAVTVTSLAAGFTTKLAPGDVVTPYTAYEDQTTGVMVSECPPELQYMEVAAISNAKGVNVDEIDNVDVIPNTVTLVCIGKQAARLVELEKSTGIHLAFVGNDAKAKRLLTDFNKRLRENDIDTSRPAASGQETSNPYDTGGQVDTSTPDGTGGDGGWADMYN